MAELMTLMTLVGLALATAGLVLSLCGREWRGRGGTAVLWASYVWGAEVWLWCAAIVLAIWGVTGLLVGIFLLGVGVLPVALLALAAEVGWGPVLSVMLAAGLVFGVRAVGLALLASAERQQLTA